MRTNFSNQQQHKEPVNQNNKHKQQAAGSRRPDYMTTTLKVKQLNDIRDPAKDKQQL